MIQPQFSKNRSYEFFEESPRKPIKLFENHSPLVSQDLFNREEMTLEGLANQAETKPCVLFQLSLYLDGLIAELTQIYE